MPCCQYCNRIAFTIISSLHLFFAFIEFNLESRTTAVSRSKAVEQGWTGSQDDARPMPLQIATSTETAPNLIISSPTPLATAPPDVPHAFSNAPPHVDADSLSPPTNSSEFPPKTTTSPAGTHPTRLETARKRLRPYYAWAAPHLTRKGLAPVVRSSVALFVGLILLLVQRTQLALGPGAFIVLIGTLSSRADCVDVEVSLFSSWRNRSAQSAGDVCGRAGRSPVDCGALYVGMVQSRK